MNPLSEAEMANPFGRGFTVSPKAPTIITSSSDLTNLVNQYYTLLVDPSTSKRTEENIDQHFKPSCLTPVQIQEFLNITAGYENISFYSDTIGRAVTKLIECSYEHGHQLFALDLAGLKPIHFLCKELLESPQKPLTIMVRGRTGRSFGNMSEGGMYVVDKLEYGGFDLSHNGRYFIRECEGECCMAMNPEFCYIKAASQSFGEYVRGGTFYIGKCDRRSFLAATGRFYIEEVDLNTDRSPNFPLKESQIYSSSKEVLEGFPTYADNCTLHHISREEVEEKWKPFHEAFKEWEKVFGERP